MNLLIGSSSDVTTVLLVLGLVVLAIVLMGAVISDLQSKDKAAEILSIIPHVYEEVTRTCDGCIYVFNSELGTPIHNGKKPIAATRDYYAASTAASLFCLFVEYKKRHGAESGHKLFTSMLTKIGEIARVDSDSYVSEKWKPILNIYSMHVGTDVGSYLMDKGILVEDMYTTAAVLAKCAFELVLGDEGDIEEGCKRFAHTFEANALQTKKIVEAFYP